MVPALIALAHQESRRTDMIQPKWDLVGIHTGHSDYKAIKPYFDIVDSIKASSMTKFDGLI